MRAQRVLFPDSAIESWTLLGEPGTSGTGRAVPGIPGGGRAVAEHDQGVRLGNLNTASYALELWATAELRHGRIERAGRLLALAERGYQQTSSRPWRTDTGPHRQLHAALHAGLGDRYQQLLAEARDVDLDEAITELARSQASAH
jgi:hypothetical protein